MTVLTRLVVLPRAVVAHRNTAAVVAGALRPHQVRWKSNFDLKNAGSVGQSKEFGEKRKAEEDMYVRERSMAQLKLLQEELAKTEKTLAATMKQLDEIKKDIDEGNDKAKSEQD